MENKSNLPYTAGVSKMKAKSTGNNLVATAKKYIAKNSKK